MHAQGDAIGVHELIKQEHPLKLFGWGTKAPKAKVEWWAPYWFHIPRTWQTWRLLVKGGTLARVSIVSLVVGGAIVGGLKMWMPMIQLPPWWKMLLALPTCYAYFIVILVVHAAIPSRIDVRKDRIHSMTGQSQWVVKAEAIRRTRIVIFAVDRIRLRVSYLHKDKLRSRTFGVARRVNLNALAEVLPVEPQVWDARDRYDGMRRRSGEVGSGRYASGGGDLS